MVVADANGVLGYADWNPNITPETPPPKKVTIGYWAGLWMETSMHWEERVFLHLIPN
ncbi:hypothetical protein [Chryseobacterium sp. Bi04]|uniref:hypothetical protein n=1 Tax=Chryseobacterium sp. Bi04 TaxID=2822345 RepID=UPI001E4D974E|nr:hypothetical protein [Chryseobacterium sp. Bi04]